MLHDLYAEPDLWGLPFSLLAQRQAHENISHHKMPTWAQHVAYLTSRPHEAWYWFATDAGIPAGCIYLSNRREIGIGVLRPYQRQGLAKRAICELMMLHPGTFFANVNPGNAASRAVFEGMDFRLLQVTYAK